MSKSYTHVALAALDRPWAILPATLDVICEVIAMRQAGAQFSPEEVAERIGAAPTRNGSAARAGAVGVLPLHGVIMHRAGMMAETSGALSLERWMRDFRSFMADEEIGTIVLDVDSPGGEVAGMPEAAAEIRAAREQKRVVAVANPMAASGAYWLASQASEFHVSPSGAVGSIGVYSSHDNLAAAYEMAGVETSLIYAGKFKVEGHDLGPLSEAAREHRQSIVDDYYGMFVGDVAKGRGATSAVVKSDMGEGRMLLAKHAKAAGMVDGIMTLDEVIRRAAGSPRPTANARALALDDLAPAGLAIGEDDGELPAGATLDTTSVLESESDADPAPPSGATAEWYALRARARSRR